MKMKKGIFVSLSDQEKPNFIKIVKTYSDLGFEIFSTHGTGEYLKNNDINSTIVGRADETISNFFDYSSR
jgi:AICAR transformylase/IMP cyclohydrolase PurH